MLWIDNEWFIWFIVKNVHWIFYCVRSADCQINNVLCRLVTFMQLYFYRFQFWISFLKANIFSYIFWYENILYPSWLLGGVHFLALYTVWEFGKCCIRRISPKLYIGISKLIYLCIYTYTYIYIYIDVYKLYM